jgi:hypothetical protein
MLYAYVCNRLYTCILIILIISNYRCITLHVWPHFAFERSQHCALAFMNLGLSVVYFFNFWYETWRRRAAKVCGSCSFDTRHIRVGPRLSYCVILPRSTLIFFMKTASRMTKPGAGIASGQSRSKRTFTDRSTSVAGSIFSLVLDS